jgi:hypothetical protein
MLYAASILLGFGTLAVWTYRDPGANGITKLMDSMWKRFPPTVPIDYRTWYLYTGLACAVGGLVMAILALA